MIIDVWKPIFQGSGKNKIVIRYDVTSIDSIIIKNKKGYKVRYTCDICKNGIINNTYSGSLLESVWNNINTQMCRKCRSRKSEYEIKKTQIEWNILLESFVLKNYQLVTTEDEYNIAINKSHYMLSSICNNGHEYRCTWNNWSKGKICRKCYDKNRYSNSVKFKDGYDLYYFLVWNHTHKNYKKYKHIINPNNLERGIKKYQLDHKFSISEGMKRGILPSIIGSVHNLGILTYSNNSSKGGKCSITIEELLEKYYSI